VPVTVVTAVVFSGTEMLAVAPPPLLVRTGGKSPTKRATAKSSLDPFDAKPAATIRPALSRATPAAPELVVPIATVVSPPVPKPESRTPAEV
jgi:hypothetical protein